MVLHSHAFAIGKIRSHHKHTVRRMTARPPIIITTIRGGLANQMFQYAVARRLAYISGGHVVLRLADDFEAQHERVFGLRHFNISADILYESKLAATLRQLFPAHPQPIPEKIVVEREYQEFVPYSGTPALAGLKTLLFVPELLAWRDNIQLAGYWQTERYFADVPDLIRHDFTLKDPPDARNQAMLARIRSRPSAFIHVRRGDYTSPHFARMFGSFPPAYYHHAAQILRTRFGADLPFYVFSDDPAWVKQNQIGGSEAVFVDWNDSAPQCDLTLMAACRYAVMSNSSFSWWGAWLGERSGGMVIAPRTWFKSIPEFQDVVPDRWLKI